MICTIFFTVIDSYRQKNNNNTGVGGMGVILPGVERGRDFPPGFFVGIASTGRD